MERDEDIKYPRLGQFGNPDVDDPTICNWCGKRADSQLSRGNVCSSRCNAALGWKHYRYFPKMLPIFFILYLYIFLSFRFDVYSLVVSASLLLILTAMIGYGLWMSWYGRKMRMRSLDYLLDEDL